MLNLIIIIIIIKKSCPTQSMWIGLDLYDGLHWIFLTHHGGLGWK